MLEGFFLPILNHEMLQNQDLEYFFLHFKAFFLYLCILRKVKGHRQVYLYFACLEIKVFAPLSLVLMPYFERQTTSHKIKALDLSSFYRSQRIFQKTLCQSVHLRLP